jgi:hypothetical protein
MLPDFRFLIGALLATGMLGVAGFGLATAVRLSHEARVGPSEATRSLAFDDRADWNQFSDPEPARRFAHLARQPDDAPPIPDAAATAGPAPADVASVPEASEQEEPSAITPADTDINVAMVEEKAADLKQEASPESEALMAAIVPAAQEPIAPVAVANPVEPFSVVADTGTPADLEIADAPTTVEVAIAPTAVEVTAEPKAAERVASTSAAIPDEETARPVLQRDTPLPRPKPKAVVRQRPAKVKVARAAKPRPRPTAKPPAASTSVPNKNDPWGGNGSFFRP